jgi:broad specificity phosphatase PhoE
MKIFLVRHGETTINKQYRFLGHFDVDLSPEGVKQAQIAASVVCNAVVCNVAKKPGTIKLYSSDLARTIQTANIIAGRFQAIDTITDAMAADSAQTAKTITGSLRDDGAITGASHDDSAIFAESCDNSAVTGTPHDNGNVTRTPRNEDNVTGVPPNLEVHGRRDLREIDFGDWEGLTYDEIRAVDGQQFDAWIKDYTSVKIPGGESWADFTYRIASAMHGILEDAHEHEDETIVIATHGGPIRFITSCFVEDADHFQNFWPSPGSVHMLDVIKRDVSETCRLAGSGKNDDKDDDGNVAAYGVNCDDGRDDMVESGFECGRGGLQNSGNVSGSANTREQGYQSGAARDGENNYQTDGCLKLSRAYKLENYRFNLQIS